MYAAPNVFAKVTNSQQMMHGSRPQGMTMKRETSDTGLSVDREDCESISATSFVTGTSVFGSDSYQGGHRVNHISIRGQMLSDSRKCLSSLSSS